MKSQIKHISFTVLVSIFFYVFWPNTCLAAALNPNIDSCLTVLKTCKEDTNKVILLEKIAWDISYQDLQKAITYSEESVVLAKKLKYERFYPVILHTMGAIYADMGEHGKALDLYLEALKYSKKYHQFKQEGFIYNSLGVLYDKRKEFNKSLYYYSLAVELHKKYNNEEHLYAPYNNMGGIYIRKGNLDSAIYFIDLCTKYNLKNKNKFKLINNYITLSDIYYSTKNKKACLQYANAAVKIARELKTNSLLAHALVQQGNAFHLNDNAPEATRSIKESEALGKQIGDMTLLETSAFYLSRVYEKNNDFKNALSYYKDFKMYGDSLLSIESIQQTKTAEAKYESKQKQKENETLAQKNQLLFQQNKIQDLKILQSRYFIFGLLLLLVLIVIITILLIRQNKAAALFEKSEMEQKLLRSQMNPHFIFNAMAGIQSYIYKEEPEAAANYLSSVVYLMRSIIDNSKKEFILLENEISTLQHYLTLQKVRFQDKFNFTIEIDPKLDIESTFIPPMMAQPFIENALGHGILHKTNGPGTITIRFEIRDKNIQLEIEDNGIGRDKAKEHGTADGTHLSIATTVTKERLSILNRKSKNKSSMAIIDLKDESGQATGTKIIFSFPLK